jgi:hypothetical protein
VPGLRRLHGNLDDRIGRCCKVGKETIFGMLKALEMFVNQDFEASLKVYDERAQVITDALKKFGVMALPRQFNPQALGNVTPRYSWHIDRSTLKIVGAEVMQKLADTPPIGIGSMGSGASGLRGRNPGAPAGDKDGAIMLMPATRTASALRSGSSKMARRRSSRTAWYRSSVPLQRPSLSNETKLGRRTTPDRVCFNGEKTTDTIAKL